MITHRRYASGRLWVVAGLTLFLISSVALSQINTRITRISPANATTGQSIAVSASLAKTDGVQRMVFVYRSFGESEYKKVDMDIRGNVATCVVPGPSVQSPFLEYYIVFQLANGSYETYPVAETSDPLTNPPQRTGRIGVSARGTTKVIFLSPDTDLPIAPGDVLISFSMLRVDSTVDRTATRVFLDDADVTKGVVLSGDIGVLVPDNIGIQLSPGQHSVKVVLSTKAHAAAGVASTDFVVSGVLFQFTRSGQRSPYSASVLLESRNEALSSGATWYNRATVNVNGHWGDIKAKASTFLTSEEASSLQPQDRFFVGVETPWARLGYGDQTPSFPDLILSGKRVRGLHAGISLGYFNLDVSSGQVTRPIDGTLLAVVPDSLIASVQASDPTSGYRKIDQTTWGKFEAGTYERSLIAVRPSFGSGESWQVGFTWLHSKDDVGSITNGSRPQEDIVAGMDFVTRFDDRRIELTGQGAFSAYNSDISTGQITDGRIATLFPNDSSTVKTVRDILAKFITVNEYLHPLSLKKLGTAAGEATLQLRYFDNVFRFTYLYRGADYNSFGQSFLRKDIQGFNFNDRARVLDNALLLTAGFEQLRDNTADTKPATTTYATYNFAATYAPRLDVPSVTLGYSRFDNSNGLNPVGSDSLNSVSDVTNRVYLQSSYDFIWGVSHTASLVFSTSDRSDATARGLNVSAVSAGASFASRFNPFLTTGLDLTANFNKIPKDAHTSQRLDYTTIGVNTRYEIIPSYLVLQGAASPTFGGYKRTMLDLSAEWSFYRGMRLMADFSYFVNVNFVNENVASLRYRYDL